MKPRMTYANVAATLALVFSMTGGALAAKHYLINSVKQINPKVVSALKGKTGKTGPQGLQGKEGPAGKEGPVGKEGPEGKAGASATRLWASIENNVSGVPTVLHGEGVTSVSNYAKVPGLTQIAFNRDVSHCAFQATLVSPGGGYYTPPNEITVFTGFYPFSGLNYNEVVVATSHSNTPTNGYSFSITAFC